MSWKAFGAEEIPMSQLLAELLASVHDGIWHVLQHGRLQD